jgi:hypothetical protein
MWHLWDFGGYTAAIVPFCWMLLEKALTITSKFFKSIIARLMQLPSRKTTI